MRYEAVPDDGLEGFRMGRNPALRNSGNDQNSVPDLRRKPAVAADDTEDFQVSLPGELLCSHDIDAHLFFSLPPPTEKTKTASPARALLPASQVAKTVSHPSSLVLAVSSNTLSVGA